MSNRAGADGNSSYRIGSHVLCWSDETRDLGVIIDNKLNFNCHISAIAHKAHVHLLHETLMFLSLIHI